MIAVRNTGKIKTIVIIFVVLVELLGYQAYSQRQFENLGRGLVAVETSGGVFTSWRLLGTEWDNTSYNIYRDGIKLNSTPLEVSNYKDQSGSSTSTYTVTSIKNGEESEHCAPITPLAKQYKEITLKQRDTEKYEINDGTAADLDGDGEYEIIIKRICKGWNSDNTNYSYFEAYKLDGTFLWEINVGPNILPDVEINIAAFDFDGDDKAEVFLRTSEGTIFGDGTQIGDVDGDGKTNYRYSVGTKANMQYMNEGPEFLSLVDGLTGEELDRVDFIPRGKSSDWGDSYGHRASKYFFGAPYLDGIHPSLFIGRGIYTKTIMRTYDVVNKKLVMRWQFHSGNSGVYYGQGNHNYTIADTDGDGRDEIVWGSMTVDDDGKGLFSTNFGHGDALHVGDLDPFHKGVEIFKCLENSAVWGTTFYDGTTGEIFIHHLYTKDCGRCMAGNISDDIEGCALWGGRKTFSSKTRDEIASAGGPENYRIYWDGDLLEEMTDDYGFDTTPGYGTGAIYKYGSSTPILLANGATSCNYTKGTPTLQADIFGDWREEVIWRTEDNTKIRIYTTVDPTPYRIYTLMHDHQYRQAICWQMCGYNQPPHTSFFLGETEGKTVPPPPFITNDKLVYNGSGDWSANAAIWTKNGSTENTSSGEMILFDVSAGENVSLILTDTVTPENVTVNSSGDYTISAENGKLSGTMKLVKQGQGTFQLNGTHDFSGKTEIWQGKLKFDGELSNSEVLMEFFSEMDVTGSVTNGITQRYGAVLNIAGEKQSGKLLVEGNLILEEGALLSIDISPSGDNRSDSLTINGDLTLSDKSLLKINWNPANQEDEVIPGEYPLIKLDGNLNGNLANIKVEGLPGRSFELTEKNGFIILEIKSMRQPSTVIWDGDNESYVWDLAKTDNFTSGNGKDLFVTGDNVIFNDNAPKKTVQIDEDVAPASIWVNSESDYIFNGSGKITGTSSLKKSSAGTLEIENRNDFTGKVILTGGVLTAATMPNEQRNGSIGAYSTDPDLLEIDGGTLKMKADGHVNRALTVGSNEGTLNVEGKLYWHEKIVGETLVKTGKGELLLGGLNTHNKTILKRGTLSMFNDDSNPGKTVVLEGGILQFYNDAYSYSTIRCKLESPEGKSAILNMDSRAYYTGTLTGSGNLLINLPFVRSEFKGDWSAFEGSLQFASTGSNPSDVRLNNNYGFGKAAVELGPNTLTYNMAGSAYAFGELTGTGSLTGSNGWIVGGKNSNATFDGLISAGNLRKVGTGKFTLTNANTYIGGTSIEKGTLILDNSTGSAVGSGNVVVKSGGNLAGNGSMNGSLLIENSGAVAPGIDGIGSLKTNNSITFSDNSYYSVDVNTLSNESDMLIAGGEVKLDGILYLTKTGSEAFSAESQFKLFDAPTITDNFKLIIPTSPGDGLKWDLSEMNSAGILKTALATGVHLIEKEVNIYPNPVQETLTIQLSGISTDLTFLVYDSTGRKHLEMKRFVNGSTVLELSQLNSGIYVLHIVGEENVILKTIVKL